VPAHMLIRTQGEEEEPGRVLLRDVLNNVCGCDCGWGRS
jgi:hypothetical protein